MALTAEAARLLGSVALTDGDFEALERACRDAALGVMAVLVAAWLNADRGDTHATMGLTEFEPTNAEPVALGAQQLPTRPSGRAGTGQARPLRGNPR